MLFWQQWSTACFPLIHLTHDCKQRRTKNIESHCTHYPERFSLAQKPRNRFICSIVFILNLDLPLKWCRVQGNTKAGSWWSQAVSGNMLTPYRLMTWARKHPYRKVFFFTGKQHVFFRKCINSLSKMYLESLQKVYIYIYIYIFFFF